MAMVQLRELASLITKGTTPTSVGYEFCNDGINFIKIESITENGGFLIDKFSHISQECDEKIKRSRIEKNDILFSIAGAIGRVALVDESILPANTNQALAIIRIPNGMIYYPYLVYVLKSPNVIEQFEKKKQGVAQFNISLKDVGDFLIPVPKMNVQKSIACKLDRLTTLISLRQKQLEKLDELVKSRFIEMFGDPLLDIDKYHKVPLGSLTDVGSSKRIFEREYVSKGVPFYRTKEIVELSKGNPVSTELFITQDRYNEICREYGAPEKGDLLVSAVGTIGVIWIVDGKNDFYYKDGNLLRVSVTKEFVPIYLKHLLEVLICIYKSKMSSGTAYAALTISALREMMVYKVPLEEQTQFAAFVTQIDKSKQSIQKSLEQLETLKKSLVQKYFG